MVMRPGGGDDPLRRARHSIGKGEFREAADLLADLRESLSDSPEWWLLMAMASWRLGNFAESYETSQRALRGYRGRGDVDGEMRAQNVAAAGAFALGLLADAETGFERSLHLARQLSDKLQMAQCANNLGNVAYYRDEPVEALRRYGQAAYLFEQVGSLRGIAEAWHNAGVVLRETNEIEAAREASDKAVEAAEQLSEPRIMGWALGGSGETDVLEGDLRLGQARTERALELVREQEDRISEVECLRVLAIIGRKRGSLDHAEVYARDALSLAKELQHSWMIAKAAEELGIVLDAREERGAASDAFYTAAEAYAQTGAEVRAAAVREMM
jgi:tetratricopeptide (TPR) repeat protein